ncbi:MAG: nucleoside hydrolase [Rhodospirillaceae bacterium]|nr:nucleoside hydrolase [Rhodospirillaceae bacterium]
MPRKLILDVDTGTDDAVAIMLAALHPALELVACTTVNGNVEAPYATDNTLRVLDHIGRSDVPVHEGLARPIVRPDFPVPRRERDLAGQIHGRTLPVPPPRRGKAPGGAVEFLIETYRRAGEDIALVAVAPLSNLAAALALDPGFAARVPELVIMGGGHEIGNVTPAAEFNIWADPEAAAMVFAAGFRKLTLVPLDATHRALVSRAHCARLEALGTPAGRAAAAFIGHRIETHDRLQRMATPGTAPVHDALCVGLLIDPTLVTTRRLHVAVETRGALTVGRTVIDTHQRGGEAPNCDVAFDADAERFAALLIGTFARTAGGSAEAAPTRSGRMRKG